MNEPFSASFDNSTEAISSNSGAVQPTTMKPGPVQSVSAEMAATVGLVVCSIAVVANTVVLTVMIRARRQFGSSVHTLISNQSAMDLVAACFSIPVFITAIKHRFNYDGSNEFLEGAICVMLQNGLLGAFALTAEKIGLVVITLERYFKIVHAIAHRKHYRSWMTKVGVALPWIAATCLYLIPSMSTTRIVDGRCLRTAVWPNEAMNTVLLHLFP